MTLAASVPKEIFDGNDVATNFPFGHKFWEDSDLVVKHKSIGGTVTTLVLDTDYTVNGAGTATGSVDFPKGGSAFGTLATGEKLMVRRVLIKQQTPDAASGFFFGTINKSADYQMAVDQELLEMINRAPLYDDFNATAILTGEEMQALGEGVLTGAFGFEITGAGAAISNGIYVGKVRGMPYAGTITGVSLYSDQDGDVTVDILKTTHLLYEPGVHPVAGDSIIGAGTKPALSSASKYEDGTLTNWSLTFQPGEVFALSLTGAATIEELTVDIRILKAGS